MRVYREFDMCNQNTNTRDTAGDPRDCPVTIPLSARFS